MKEAKGITILKGEDVSSIQIEAGCRLIIRNLNAAQKKELLKEVGLYNTMPSDLFYLHYSLEKGVHSYKIIDLPCSNQATSEMGFDSIQKEDLSIRQPEANPENSLPGSEVCSEALHAFFFQELEDIMEASPVVTRDGKTYAVEFRLLDAYFNWDIEQAKKKSKFVPRKQDPRGVINITVDGYYDQHETNPQQWLVCRVKGSWETSSSKHKMNYDKKDERGWYIGKVELQMNDLHQDCPQLFYNDSIPKNINNSHTISETTSFDISVDSEGKAATTVGISETVNLTYNDWDCIQKSFTHWLFRQGFPSKGDCWSLPTSAFECVSNDIKPLPNLSKQTTYFDLVTTWKTDRVIQDVVPLNFLLEVQYNYLGANWGYDYWWGNRVSRNLPFQLDMGKIR